MITRHGLDGRSLVQGEDGAIFGDDLLPPPLSYFSLFFPPQFKRRWLPPSGHLSHPETVMNHLSYQFDGTISEITITVQCI